MPEDERTEFDVVINDEEQYSIWRVGQAMPLGWHPTGFRGSREDCLAHIESVWTDMRPLSLRKAMGDYIPRQGDAEEAPGSGRS